MVRYLKKNGQRIQLLPPPTPPEDPVTCPYCSGPFDGGDKRRCRLTKCGHLSCLQCLLEVLKSEGCRQCLSSSGRPKRDRRLPKRFRDEEVEVDTIKKEVESAPVVVKVKAKPRPRAPIVTKVTHGIREPDPRKPNAQYFCLCGEEFTNRNTILSHILRKNRGKVYGCPVCPFKVDTHTKFKIHLKNKHRQRKYEWPKYSCGKCGLGALFHCWKDLCTHQRLVHNIRHRRRRGPRP